MYRSIPLVVVAMWGCQDPCPLIETHAVSVDVQDAAGGDLTDATVSWWAEGGTPAACDVTEGASFVCASGVSGELTVRVEAEGYVPHEAIVTVEADDCGPITEALDVTLEVADVGCPTDQELASIEAWVFAAGGGELTNVAVTYAPDGGGDATACDYDNMLTYWICGVEEAGSFVVTASADGRETEWLTLDVEHDGCNVITEQHTFELEPAAP